MRNVVARCMANTMCHEAYHSLLTVQPADQQAIIWAATCALRVSYRRTVISLPARAFV